MKPLNRNIVFRVSTTRTFKSDNPSPGKETWDSDDEKTVLATDAEHAISQVRHYFNKEDKEDGTMKRRTTFVFNSVAIVTAVDIY